MSWRENGNSAFTEIEHPSGALLWLYVGRMPDCPYRRWVFAVDTPDVENYADDDVQPFRPKSLAIGYAFGFEEAAASAEAAAKRLILRSFNA